MQEERYIKYFRQNTDSLRPDLTSLALLRGGGTLLFPILFPMTVELSHMCGGQE